MTDTVIKVDGVSKKFCRTIKHTMLYGATDLTRSFLGLNQYTEHLRNAEFWALDDVNFELKQGETLGIIGPNGSGKSTMLKMLNGIFMPDRGKIDIKGRMGALIEVGAGFHPMLTGRENIYINGSILGMSKKEIDSKFDDIVDFADIGEFIDSPVKHYSSGMNVRLGVSVATCLEPEVLLIDEVLSVGDLSFQNKSLRRLAEIREKANAIVFVSHNLDHVKNLCQKVLVINKGITVFYGDTEEALLKYHEISRESRLVTSKNKYAKLGHRTSSGDVDIINQGLLDKKGNVVEKTNMGDDINLFFDLKILNTIDGAFFSATIRDENNNICLWYKSNEGDNKTEIEKLHGGCTYRLIIRFIAPPFMPGLYKPTLGILNEETLERYEKIFNLPPFHIDGEVIPRGLINCYTSCELEEI